MDDLNKELDSIMADAMSKIDAERLSHQKTVIGLLEKQLFESRGLPQLGELYGIVPMAEGRDEIDKIIATLPDDEKNLVDATRVDDDIAGVMGLMRIIHCGEGTDIYEPLHDVPTQCAMAEHCAGLMIRVPVTGKEINNETKHDGVITCLALENVISMVVRINDGNASVEHCEIFDVNTYTLGSPERKLIDAVYLAYFMPRYLKEHSELFYRSILSFVKWRSELEGNATDGD